MGPALVGLESCIWKMAWGGDFQRATLSNGVEVLMARYEDQKDCAVDLRIRTCEAGKPSYFEPLKTFVPHAVLAGSRRYPGRNTYHDFFKAHGGSAGCKSLYHRDAYFFSIDTENFQEGLMRLADAVSAPELGEHGAEAAQERFRSSYFSTMHSDTLRMLDMQRQLLHLQAVDLNTALRAEGMIDRAHDFVARHHRPKNMALMMTAGLDVSFDDMVRMAEKSFGKIIDQSSLVNARPAPRPEIIMKPGYEFYKTHSGGKLIKLSTQSKDKHMRFSMRVPPDSHVDSVMYWQFVLESSRPGTFTYVTKSAGWIKEVVSEFILWDDVHSSIYLHCVLTEEGMKENVRISNMFFDYLDSIRDHEPQFDTFEQSETLFCSLSYRNSRTSIDRARYLGIASMMTVPDVAEEKVHTEQAFNPEAISMVGSFLTLENSDVLMLGNNFCDLPPDNGGDNLMQFSVELFKRQPYLSLLRFPGTDPFFPPARPVKLEPASDLIPLQSVPPLFMKSTNTFPVLVRARVSSPVLSQLTWATRKLYGMLLTYKFWLITTEDLISANFDAVDEAIEITVVCTPDVLVRVLQHVAMYLAAQISVVYTNRLNELKADELKELLNPTKDELKFDERLDELLGVPSTAIQREDFDEVKSPTEMPYQVTGDLTVLVVGNVNKELSQAVLRALMPLASKEAVARYEQRAIKRAAELQLNPDSELLASESEPQSRGRGEELFANPDALGTFGPTESLYLIGNNYYEGSAMLLAFRCGPFSHGLWARTLVACAVYSAQLNDNLRVGQLVAHSVKAEAMRKLDDVWVVFKIISHTQLDVLRSRVKTTILEGMQEGMIELTEDQLQTYIKKALEENIDTVPDLKKEADRLWGPIRIDPFDIQYEPRVGHAVRHVTVDDVRASYMLLRENYLKKQMLTLLYKRRDTDTDPGSELEFLQSTTNMESVPRDFPFY